MKVRSLQWITKLHNFHLQWFLWTCHSCLYLWNFSVHPFLYLRCS
jgi:hypothetical protein